MLCRVETDRSVGARRSVAASFLSVLSETSSWLIAREMGCRLTPLSDDNLDWVQSIAASWLRRLAPYPGTTRRVLSLMVSVAF